MANDVIIPDVTPGENSRLYIGGSNLSIKRITVRETPNTVSTGSNRTGGFTTRRRQLYDCTIDFEAQFQPGDNPLTDPPNLAIGSDTDTVLYYPDEVNLPSSSYHFPVGYCEAIEVTTEGEGVVTYRGTIKNQGEYGSPGYPVL